MRIIISLLFTATSISLMAQCAPVYIATMATFGALMLVYIKQGGGKSCQQLNRKAYVALLVLQLLTMQAALLMHYTQSVMMGLGQVMCAVWWVYEMSQLDKSNV